MGYANEAKDLQPGPDGRYIWQGCPFVGDEPPWTDNYALVRHEAECGRQFFVGRGRQRRRCYRPQDHKGAHFLGDSRWVQREPDARRSAS